MSRSGYSDDDDDDGGSRLNLWRGAVERAIKGKRGQAFLRELGAALDAMPDKRLTTGELEAGMETALFSGSGSCVWSEGCNGVKQDHLERFAALAAALPSQVAPQAAMSAGERFDAHMLADLLDYFRHAHKYNIRIPEPPYEKWIEAVEAAILSTKKD